MPISFFFLNCFKEYSFPKMQSAFKRLLEEQTKVPLDDVCTIMPGTHGHYSLERNEERNRE